MKRSRAAAFLAAGAVSNTFDVHDNFFFYPQLFKIWIRNIALSKSISYHSNAFLPLFFTQVQHANAAGVAGCPRR
jgi:hypothetical protein